MKNNIYSFLGLAKKADKLLSGGYACKRAIKSQKIFLVILAEDASDNTKKEFINACNSEGIEIRFFGEKELLGRFIGKGMRSVIAVLDENFAKGLIEKIDKWSIENGGGTIGKG